MGHKLGGGRESDSASARYYSSRDGQLGLWEKLNRRPLSSADEQIVNVPLSGEYVSGCLSGAQVQLNLKSCKIKRRMEITVVANEPGVEYSYLAGMGHESHAAALPLNPQTPVDFSFEYRKKYSELLEALQP